MNWEPQVLIRSEDSTEPAAEQVERFLAEGVGEKPSEAVAFYWERHWFQALVFPSFDEALSWLAHGLDAGELAPEAIRADGEVLKGDEFKNRLWDTPVYR